MSKNLIIAFLLGMLVMNYAYAMKIPDVILSSKIDPDLREIIEDYVVKIINESRYTMKVSNVAVASGDELESGEFKMDNSGLTKRFCLSNGTSNYYVNLTGL